MIYGNGLPAQYRFDLDYRLAGQLVSSAIDRSYNYDEADNITGIINNLSIGQDQTYVYDGLSRLIDAQGFYGNLLYQYDDNGNRAQSSDDSSTDNYHYPPESNRLQRINSSKIYRYDASGNTTQLPNPDIFTRLVYGDHNRLSAVNGVTYTYTSG
jgi:YD repeat-containing protein